MAEPGELILVTGAAGYVGRHLVPHLLAHGQRVRCLVHASRRLAGLPWLGQVELITGDALDPHTLAQALQGVSSAYYLIHSMASGADYAERDRQAARRFAAAAEQAGVRHIIYLGGLAHSDRSIGRHMLSRLQTGEVLREGKTPVTELRASVIIGPGSISFEMIRYLAEQLPVLIGPRWLQQKAQPIAIRSVIDYLLAALQQPPEHSAVYEIGGPDVLSYAELMLGYARERGLKRRLLTLPSLPVGLMALAVDRLTPVPLRIARPLIGSLRGDSVVRQDAARGAFPQVRLLNYAGAVRAALSRLTPEQVEPFVYAGEAAVRRVKHEGFFIDRREVRLQLPGDVVFQTVCALGGKNGWLYLNGLWKLRAWLDRRLGGPGMRGRAEGEPLKVGALVDFYTVDWFEAGKKLRLRADLKAPGTGWMEWQVLPASPEGTRLVQTAYFAPRGLAGFAYHYLLQPVHRLVYAGLLRRIAEGQRAIRQ